jgi:putative hemolysin
MPDPASTNCVDKGGKIIVQTDGSGGQYGICDFGENRQCEEWAMMRGECPVGGLKVTGYITPASRLCVITGGEYQITAKSGAEDEQGTCTFKSGKSCDVWEYFNRKCDKNK